ncbi:MAG: TIGR03905 family TSCPD domain-containing protein [Clostridia bacterium]|nr:TIGR03905 family TSCPD domain-containing protein [Clostridia bacterium]
MEYTVRPKGVCSMQIKFEIDDNKIVKNVKFTGGCNGNSKGLSALVEGMKADEVIARLSGINCNGKGTSCPDQLARAIFSAVNE